MKLRLFIIIFFVGFAALLKAQDTPTKIKVLESDYLVVEEGGSRNWIINGTFEHENATMRCDSAFLNNTSNTLEAYGHVFIRQNDTITLQSDRLFYDGNTRLARMYDNITLSDGQAVLTTDFMTYDMNTREGTYYNGGKIVNGVDTLTSTRGYYYVNNKDSYFREKAVVTTPDALIKSDTLRYNTGTRVAYFYGPTTIQGEDDFIYAENGTYNTDTDQANFQENAYYRSGNQLLKGNRLYYDRQRNFGRATGNVFIIDTAENIILRGELGEYNKATETAFVTDSARVLMIAEQDSARTDTIYMAADTLKTRLLPVPLIEEWIQASHERDVLGREEQVASEEGLADTASAGALSPDSLAAADSLAVTDSLAAGGIEPSPADTASLADAGLPPDTVPPEEARPAPADTALAGAPFIGPPPLKPSDYLPAEVADSLSLALADSISRKPGAADSAAAAPVDSARVLFAYHRVRIYKSNLQAITDSLMYTDIDSVMRCYKDPVVWSESSQMSAEFMTIAMRNKKIDNMKMYRSAMILNKLETDTAKYNQMSGTDMVGIFEKGALTRLVVEGNARTIYYVQEDSAQTTGINYAENSRSILHFEDNDLKLVELLKDVDQITYPEGDPEAVTRLLGFHWRENERPLDKYDIFRRVEPSAPPPPPESAAPKALRSGTVPPGNRRNSQDQEPGDQVQPAEQEPVTQPGQVQPAEQEPVTQPGIQEPVGQPGFQEPAGQQPADQQPAGQPVDQGEFNH